MNLIQAETPSTSTIRRGAGLFALFLVSIWVVLAGWAFVPRVLGWHSYVVPNASMEPALSRGDVLLGSPPPAAGVRPGTVVLVEVDGEAAYVRRVAAITPDGRYATTLYATGRVDRTPVDPANVVAVGRVLVPYAGLPAIWFGTGTWPAALAWSVVMLGAALLVPFALRPVEDVPELPAWLRTAEPG